MKYFIKYLDFISEAKNDDEISQQSVRIKSAINMLQSRYPHVSGLLSVLPVYVHADSNFPTAHTDFSGVYFNSDFAKQCSTDNLMFLTVHEIMHVAMDHLDRGAMLGVYTNSKTAEIWNYACDYAINPMISNPFTPGMSQYNIGTFIKGGLIDPAFFGMTAEEIYEIVKSSPEKYGCGGNEILDISKPGSKSPKGATEVFNPKGKDSKKGKDDKGNKGNKDDKDDKDSKKSGDLARVEMDRLRRELGKMVEKLPAGVTREFHRKNLHKVDWKRLLKKYVDDMLRSENYRFDRRFMGSETYIRTAKDADSYGAIRTMLIAIDTSGSIGEHELSIFAAILSQICKNADINEVTIVPYDAKIDDSKVIKVKNPKRGFDLKTSGGGGNDFKELFRWMRRNRTRPSVIVYLTDGQDEFPSFGEFKEYENKTIWVIIDSNKPTFVAPMGKTLHLYSKDLIKG